MLKPALARGLQIVGATTFDEYRKTIEKDAALARRFQPIQIAEPSVEETITMLRGLRGRYESHHGVAISDSALVAAAQMARRYITSRVLPDSAIDLVDEAASSLRLQQESKPEPVEALDRQMISLKIELESLKRDTDAFSVNRKAEIETSLTEKAQEVERLNRIWEEDRGRLNEIKEAKRQLEEANAELEDCQRKGDYARASELQYQVIKSLKDKIPSEEEAATERKLRLQEAGTDDEAMILSDRVSSDDIARVVGRTTGIPVRSLLRGEVDRLLHLEDELRRRVIGQESALHSVAEAVRLSRAGLNLAGRPIASFLFLGPTGVGKTELSKALSAFLFDSERSLITINMSEFGEKHTVSRLLGAPAGYIGFDEGGQLTEAVRRKPYAVILLDEFEKVCLDTHRPVVWLMWCHLISGPQRYAIKFFRSVHQSHSSPDVANILLQLLDEGTLTDAQGHKISFANTIIVSMPPGSIWPELRA